MIAEVDAAGQDRGMPGQMPGEGIFEDAAAERVQVAPQRVDTPPPQLGPDSDEDGDEEDDEERDSEDEDADVAVRVTGVFLDRVLFLIRHATAASRKDSQERAESLLGRRYERGR